MLYKNNFSPSKTIRLDMIKELSYSTPQISTCILIVLKKIKCNIEFVSHFFKNAFQ